MRFASVSSIAGVAVVTITLLAGCSGVSQGVVSSIPGSATSPSGARSAYPSGSNGLYISDSGTGLVEVVSNKFTKELGTIGGFGCPKGSVVDAAGNFYVADFCKDVVDEFAVGATSPSFTYSAGMTYPLSVSVDSAGNVYEADGGTRLVNEYAQGSNAILYSCAIKYNSEVVNVAIDKASDVFVEFSNGSGSGVVEFKHGLSGCHHGKPLNLGLLDSTGIALDKNDNLIITQYNNGQVNTAGAVLVSAPPYSGITSDLITGLSYPVSVTLNKANDLAFVVDSGTKVVYVLNYPSGSLYTTLSSGTFGISQPIYAVDAPNAVY